MEIISLDAADTLTLQLRGRLDVTTAPLLEGELKLDGVRELILDLDQCSYVSSAGLREFLRAQKRMATSGGGVTLINVSREVQEILELTGLSKLLRVRGKVREISIEGKEFLSAGVCGECYRLDRETIVKLYNAGVAADIAEKEKAYAKAAFVAGIPTAISYDVVACGTRTGVVYEMLEATQFSAIIRADLARMDDHGRTLARIARNIHETAADPTVFPDIKNNFRGYIRQMDFFLSDGEIEFLLERLESIPDADSTVHFDLHTSNIMIRQGEPVIIDMGDVSRGHYLFDVGVICTIYGYPELGISELATKIPNEEGARLCDHFLDHYFADKPATERAFFERNRPFLASLRLIYTITFLPAMRDQLASIIKDVLLPRMAA
jgi:uncharacterized protein (TIGR02172 family)